MTPADASNDPVDPNAIGRVSENGSRLALATIRWVAVAACILACVLFYAISAGAAELVGKVVAVADGDTLTLLVDRQQFKVRLTEIDAPEKKQPFGNRSKQSLGDMVFRKSVRVVTYGNDRFGRTLGRVYVGQQDISAEQVRRGMAWVFDRYVTDRALYPIQEEAKAAKRGLWADPHPVPPWEWRAAKRRK